MKIGIVSDTHGCAATWDTLYQRYFSDCALILHAGDVLYHGPRNAIPAEYAPKDLAEMLNACPIPMVIVAGNCDAEVDSMVLEMPIEAPYAHLWLDGRRILMLHGHQYSQAALTTMAERLKADICITGHTHIPVLHKEQEIVYINPGSPAMSKREDRQGTIALLEGRRIQIIAVQSGEVLLEQFLWEP